MTWSFTAIGPAFTATHDAAAASFPSQQTNKLQIDSPILGNLPTGHSTLFDEMDHAQGRVVGTSVQGPLLSLFMPGTRPS